MFKQLRDWMICGNLNDKYEEFYICVDKKMLAAHHQHQHLHDMTSWVGDEQEQTYTQEESGVAGGEPGSSMTKDTGAQNLNSLTEIEQLFIGEQRFMSGYSQYMLSAKLPSYLNLKVANKVR